MAVNGPKKGGYSDVLLFSFGLSAEWEEESVVKEAKAPSSPAVQATQAYVWDPLLSPDQNLDAKREHLSPARKR